MPSLVAPPQRSWEKFMEPIPNDPAVDEIREIRRNFPDLFNYELRMARRFLGASANRLPCHR